MTRRLAACPLHLGHEGRVIDDMQSDDESQGMNDRHARPVTTAVTPDTRDHLDSRLQLLLHQHVYLHFASMLSYVSLLFLSSTDTGQQWRSVLDFLGRF